MMEYTLEDAYESLKEIQTERQGEEENLIAILANNEAAAWDQSRSTEKLDLKQNVYYSSLLKQIQKDVPKDYPIPKTIDLQVQVLQEMEEEIINMQSLFNRMKERLNDIEEDISYLESKKIGLEKMREACLNATEIVASQTYDKESSVTRRLFIQVKNDLATVVDTIFPNNVGFNKLLAALSSAFITGGDDVYIDVTPDILNYVTFLIEADIATYHRNDKNKIKLTNLL